MMKWVNRALFAMAAVPVLLCTAVPASAAADDSALNVVSLGDSIARGYGCKPEEAYGYLLAQQIKTDTASKGYTVNFANYGTDGDATTDLLDKLGSDSEIDHSLEDADIVTISIGGNNLMRGVYKEFALALNLDVNSPTFESDLMKAIQTADSTTLLEKLAPIFTYDPNAKAGTDTPCERLRAIADAYQTDIAAIFQKIQSLNPDVKILLTTIPNPTKDAVLGTALDPYIQMYNDYIRSKCAVAGKIYVADSDAAFQNYTGSDPLTFTVVDWTDPSKTVLDPHPTPFGQLVMEQTHYAQIKDYIAGLPKAEASTTAPVTDSTTVPSATETASATTAATVSPTTAASATAADTTAEATTAADVSPKTGDSSMTAVFALLSAAMIACGAALYRKRAR